MALLVAGGNTSALAIGETAWSPDALEECFSGDPQEAVQQALNPNLGMGYAVPAPGGAITSWSTLAGGAPGQFVGFTVLRPVAPNTYLLVARDGPRLLAPNVLNTFPVAIPVQAGDVIGLSIPGGSPAYCRFQASPADQVGFAPGAAVGATVAPKPAASSSRLNVSAAVLPPPVNISAQPDEGSFKGGTRVSIFGANFSAVQGVSFGSTPAPSFEIVNETHIVAVAPPGRIGDKVSTTVTTVAGTATLEDAFGYEGCRVPRLTNGKLKAAKKKIRKAGCGIGRVRKIGAVTGKTGTVVRQSPKPGKVLPPGAKIRLTLGP